MTCCGYGASVFPEPDGRPLSREPVGAAGYTTFAHALLEGSAAINAGKAGTCTATYGVGLLGPATATMVFHSGLRKWSAELTAGEGWRACGSGAPN